MPSRRAVLVTGGAIAALALLVLLLPTSVVDPTVRRSVSRFGSDCTDLLGVEVDSGAWPTVARSLAGQLRDVSIHADEMRSDGFSYYDVSFSADRVDIAPLGGMLSDREPQVHGGDASATVRFSDIETLIARYGTVVHLRQQGAQLVADVEVPLLGLLPTTVQITPVEGDMELVFAPLDMFTLPAVRVPIPAPLSLRQVDVQGDAVRFDSTVDGVIPADDFGCDVS